MSIRTTYFGPRVSFRTTLADSGPVHVHLDSNSTFENDGPSLFDGTARFASTASFTNTLNVSGGTFLSRATTASLTSATLADGELAVGARSATSIILYYRSGNTTYRILADSAAVL